MFFFHRIAQKRNIVQSTNQNHERVKRIMSRQKRYELRLLTVDSKTDQFAYPWAHPITCLTCVHAFMVLYNSRDYQCSILG